MNTNDTLGAVTEISCERCHRRRTGRAYVFYYGREQSSSERFVGGNREVTTRYVIGGSQRVEVCDDCVKRRRLKGVLVPLGAALAILVFGLVWHGDLICVVPAFILFLWSLYVLSRSKQERGANIAYDVRQQALEKQGWDTGWSPDEYSKLKPADHRPF